MVKYRTPGQAGLVQKRTAKILKTNAHNKLTITDQKLTPHRLKELIAKAKKNKKWEE